MASETATPVRNLGPEFWAVIATVVAIAALADSDGRGLATQRLRSCATRSGL